MTAEYLFPRKCGYFSGTESELVQFASKIQRENILGENFISGEDFLSNEDFISGEDLTIAHPKVVSYLPIIVGDEARWEKYLAEHREPDPANDKPINWQ